MTKSQIFRLLLTVVAITALFYLEEDFRGKRAWDHYRREWEAKGEHFDTAAFIPPPIPDEQNFAAIPFFAAMFDYYRDPKIDRSTALLSRDATHWRDPGAHERSQFNIYGMGSPPPKLWGRWQAGEFYDLEIWQEHYRSDTNFPSPPSPDSPANDVLTALTRFDEILEKVRVASARPDCRFPIHYDEGPAAMLPHINALRNLCRLLSLRASSELRLGSNDQAFADVSLGFRLIESLKSEPLVISQLVRRAMLDETVQAIWEGLAEHRWTDEQLKFFQTQLKAFDFLDDAQRTMKYVRAEMNDRLTELRLGTVSAHDFLLLYTVIDTLGPIEDIIHRPLAGERLLGIYLRLGPSGWFYLDQVRLNRFCQESFFPAINASQQRVFPEESQYMDSTRENVSNIRNPRRRMIALLEVGFSGSVVWKFALAQTEVNEACIACALERCRLKNGRYPEKLEELAPEFMAVVPHDVVNGEPLAYSPTDDGRFVLTSAGWAKAVPSKDTSLKSWRDTGEWTWRYPSSIPANN